MRATQIQVRVSDAEYDAIYAAAKRLSMAPSAYLRHVALHALPLIEIEQRLSALEARAQ